MPLSSKDREIEEKFEREYPGRGKRVYYATINSGKLRNTPEARRMALKRKHRKRWKRPRRMM